MAKKKYIVSAQTKDYSASTTVMPERNYGAWMCVNTGTGVAKVMGYELQPSEGLNFLDAVPAGVAWDSPITIELAAGAVVRLTRLQFKETE